MPVDRNNTLLTIILVICALNLLMTGIVWLDRGQITTQSKTIDQTVSEVSELPDYLDADERKRLAKRLTVVFNKGDTSEVYALFDELVRTKLSLEEMSKKLEVMSVVGKIGRSVYTHHESKTYGSFPAYILHYSVSISDGPFKTGTLDITVIDRGNTYGILAFNVFAGAG